MKFFHLTYGEIPHIATKVYFSLKNPVIEYKIDSSLRIAYMSHWEHITIIYDTHIWWWSTCNMNWSDGGIVNSKNSLDYIVKILDKLEQTYIYTWLLYIGNKGKRDIK